MYHTRKILLIKKIVKKNINLLKSMDCVVSLIAMIILINIFCVSHKEEKLSKGKTTI